MGTNIFSGIKFGENRMTKIPFSFRLNYQFNGIQNLAGRICCWSRRGLGPINCCGSYPFTSLFTESTIGISLVSSLNSSFFLIIFIFNFKIVLFFLFFLLNRLFYFFLLKLKIVFYCFFLNLVVTLYINKKILCVMNF